MACDLRDPLWCLRMLQDRGHGFRLVFTSAVLRPDPGASTTARGKGLDGALIDKTADIMVPCFARVGSAPGHWERVYR